MTLAPPASRNAPCPCGSGKRYKHCHGAAEDEPAAASRAPDAADAQLRELMVAALAAQVANDLDAAERLYRQALERSPENVDALHMLGVVHYAKGEYYQAEGLITSAQALCRQEIPAITKNLSLVRQAALFVQREKTIQSFLEAHAAQRALGFDPGRGAVEERTTRLIAFYLPQFHRIPENDRWWGEGFTEWVNVKRARPNFKGHYQPHEPGELGYYDLADERVLARQAALAREYGISGFCFYYYWFSGRRLLEMPVDRLLRSGAPDFPYCLCWANENWSRNWDGGNRDLLVEQRYLPDDPERFIEGLLPHFRDRRYIRVGSRPLLMVYRVGLIPDPVATFGAWREVCRKHGIEAPYLVLASTFDDQRRPGDVGADAVSEFPPHGSNINLALRARLEDVRPGFRGHFVSYLQNVANFLSRPEPDYPRFPGIVPSWDNTARRQDDGLCMLESSPAAFEAWLRELIHRAARKPRPEERIVFINAWNEWAEGCHLEPDARYGRGWLEACRNARRIPEGYQGIFGAAPVEPRAAAPARTGSFPLVDLERPQLRSAPPDATERTSWVVTLFEGGERVDAAPLLWRDTLPAACVEEHERALVAPPVEVFGIADAALHGPGWVSRDGAVLFDGALYPEYCREWYRDKRIYNDVDADLGSLIVRRYRAGWHVAHFNCGVYGHWLGEVFPKLLALREFLRRWPEHLDLPIFLPSVLPQFVYAHTRSLLPQVPVVIYDPRIEYVAADTLLLPTWGANQVYPRWILDEIDRLDAARAPGAPERIFIARRRPSSFRSLDNARALEAIALEAGFAIVHPEDHALEGQIGLFRGARVVVGEFGSALHNTLFSPRGTLVVALNWINEIQSRIARSRGHRTGYLLPSSGSAVLFAPDAKVQHYSIDPDLFRARLAEALAGHARQGAAADVASAA